MNVNLKIKYTIKSIFFRENNIEIEGIGELLKHSTPEICLLQVNVGKSITTFQIQNLYKLYSYLRRNISRVLGFTTPLFLVDGAQAHSFGVTQTPTENYGGEDYGIFEFSFSDEKRYYYWDFLYQLDSDVVKLMSHNTKGNYVFCSKKQLIIQLYKLYLALVQDIRKYCHKAFFKKEIMEDYEEWKENMKKYKKAIKLL